MGGKTEKRECGEVIGFKKNHLAFPVFRFFALPLSHRSTPMDATTTLIKELRVTNHAGVHARVGTMLAKKAKEFTSNIQLRKGSYVADCRSILDLLSLGAFAGDTLHLEVTGDDATAAVDAITALFDARFFEDGGE